MTTPKEEEQLHYLQLAISAKQDYWDALRTLEKSVLPADGELNEKSLMWTDDMAAVCDDTGTITVQELREFLKLAQVN